MPSLLTIAVAYCSVLGAALLVGVLIAALVRVLNRPSRPAAWWPRFEREFAEYVERLESRPWDPRPDDWAGG